MSIHIFFIEIFAVVTFVFICCWIDKYCIRRLCKKPDEVIIRDIIRERVRSTHEINEEEGYFTQTSEETSHYLSESESDISTESESNEETTNEIRLLKPDYDEETEDEFGEPL